MTDFLQRIARLPPDRLALLAVELKDRLDRLERSVAARNEPIAVVGIGCRFPGGGVDPDSYWNLLASGVDAVREVPGERWNLDHVYDANPDTPGKVGTRWGSFLDGVDLFDTTLFGIAPREAAAVDPQQRLLLEVAWEALEDAGIAADRLVGVAGGVYVGLCNHDYQDLMLERPLETIDAHIASGSAGSMAAGRLSYVLGMQGPALTIDTACSSSLVALHLACESLHSGESRLALAAGVNLILGVTTTVGLTKARMMSPDGRCRAFDEGANGIVRGEGCGVVVLKRLSDAVADGDRIHCVIRATAVNQDGRSSGITAPNGPAQEALMRGALQRADLRAQDVDYIETHGTGTRLGDPIEVRAIGAVYGVRDAAQPLKIGSVKTNLGHLEAAAGIAGVLKVALALRHRQLPPHLHLRTRNPLIEWERWPIEIPTTLVPWEPSVAGVARRAAVSSFGFSGTNAHAIIEEYVAPAGAAPSDSALPQLLTLSARTPSALRALASAYAVALANADPGDSFVEFCATAAVGRSRFAHRAAVVATNAREASLALSAWKPGSGAAFATGRASGSLEPVFLFTGQGSQYLDMGRDLFDTEPVFRAAIERCDAALRSLDVRLIDTLYPAPNERDAASQRINETAYTQPALFALELALAELWRSWGIEPAAVAGHSVGEYAAAAFSGVLGVEDALRLLATRALAMQRLPKNGAMAAVLAGADAVTSVLGGRAGVEIAAFNSPSNLVITGEKDAVAAALREFQGRGIETRPLPVSHAFHSALIEPMLPELARFAAALRFSPAEVPFHSTLTGSVADHATLGNADYWRAQTRRPVRFAEALEGLRAAGNSVFLEIGPHPTLSAFGIATAATGEEAFLPSLRRGSHDRGELLRSLAQLDVRGAATEWGAVLGGRHRRAKIPGYPFERASHWLGWSARAHGRGFVMPAAAPATSNVPAVFRDKLWRRDWVELGASGVPRPSAVREWILPRVEPLFAEHGGAVYAGFLPRLDALCVAYIGQALTALGVELKPGARVSAPAFCAAAGVLPTHARLVRRMLEILAEDGVLASEHGEWRIVDPRKASESPGRLLASILDEFPACRAEAEFTARCAEPLAAVLRGQIDPMELLFPKGSIELTEQLYADTPSFRVFNTLVAEAVAGAVASAPNSAGVRILEVGAGTGGTAARLLPLLRPTGAKYTFTDVSTLFLDRARTRFREFGSVEYRALDISRDPGPQGFAPGSFDVIVASNVLHATPDLARSLAHVRELLAPGGLLVMLEGFRPQRFGDLTVGLTPGWWHFTDTDIRPSYALLGSDRWLALLGRCGFDDATVVPERRPDERGLLGQQGIVLARASDSTAVPGATDFPAITRWLALARPGGTSERLAQALGRSGLEVQIVDPLVSEPFDCERTFARLASGSSSYGIVHLLALDESADSEDDGGAALARQERVAGSGLRAAQAIVTRPDAPLVFVTRSSQPVGGEMVDPTGCSLWGLARTLAVEHPDVRVRAVDLPRDWESAVGRLAQVLARQEMPSEDEIALRGAAAFVPRIVAHRSAPLAEPLRFERGGSYIVTGGLAGLGLETARWLAARGAGRVVLSGRSAPTEVADAAIEALRAGGAEVAVVCGDVADPDNVRALVEAAGADRLKGVLHCAGVTADAILLRQDWEHFERVMRAKVVGAWNLHRATRDLSLDHFVLFSTGAAFVGSSGQANHAAANSFLGGLASYRRAQGLPALAVDWGAWSDVGAATRGDVIERAGASGLGTLSPDVGFAILEHLMSDTAPRVAAIAADWERFLSRYSMLRGRGLFSAVAALASRSDSTAAVAAPTSGALARTVLAAASGNRRTLLFDGLHDAAARALGLPAQQAIDPRVPLTELGLDSLMAVELRNELAAQLAQPLSATLLFSYPTLEELADYLLKEIDGGARASDAPASGSGVRLDEMDEEQMASLLESKLSK